MKRSIAARIRKAMVLMAAVTWGGVLAVAGAAHALPMVTDRSVSDAVEDQLLLDQVFFTDLIDVRTDDGVVTLSGRVDNLMAKERAGRIAEKVKGVRAVVNTIDVVPPAARTDADIQNDVKAALRDDPATDAYEIGVAVADHVVTLSGIVDSWQGRTLCGNVAKEVSGVTGLHNTIDVVYQSDRPDDEIQQDIVQALRWDVLVDNALIDVTVQDGRVRLSGTVGSLAEKARATADAYVANVRDVKAKDLDVRFWARNDQLKGDKYRGLTDSDIQAGVREALRQDPRVAAFKVTPEVADGVVTLRGTVDNLKAKRAAAQTARLTVGVLGVANRIKVRPKIPTEDAALAARITAAFKRDPVVDAPEITVAVKNGVAKLSGRVDTAFERNRADDLATKVRGVIAVRNQLVVTGYLDPYYYDPYLDDPYGAAAPRGYHPPAALESDAAIKQNIETEYFWSPFVDEDDIQVEVKNGRATLTGKVDSWTEYLAASENAFDGGAVVVYNELRVR